MEEFTSVQEFENHALSILPECVKNYYKSGEGAEKTLQWNQEAFNSIRILPRVLKDVSVRDLSTTVLGDKVSVPFGISPTAFQNMAHEDGECANARAAEASNAIFILSSYSTFSIEEVTEAAPRAIKWMQLNIYKDRDLIAHTVKKAEQFGFKALVVTVDNPVYGGIKISNFSVCMNQYISNKHKYLSRIETFLKKENVHRIAILEDYLSTRSDLRDKYLVNKAKYVSNLLDSSATWEFIDWLKSITKLPIVLKGILTPEDALLGVKHGASAILVSNHGGRQLDTEPATIEVLPQIVEAVGDKVEVYLDGGVTRGTDIFKALALGAKMVFVGRIMLWGLACGGEKGAAAIFDILSKQLHKTFALSGCSNVKQVTKDLISNRVYSTR